MKALKQVAGIALVITLFCAAIGRASSSQPAVRRPVVAVIPMATTDEYWKAIHAGSVQAAREVDADIVWQGPLRRDDRSAQVDIVENMIIRGVDGIVLAPIDNTALRGAVDNALRSGIPTVVIDSDLKSDKQVCFVATDNYKGGYIAGEYLAKLLNFRGRVALLRGLEGNASVENRERGFLDAVAHYPDMKLVSSNQRCGATLEDAYKSAENVLASQKSKDGAVGIDGIFCPNEAATFAMLRALQESNLTHKVRFIGFDASKKLNDALDRSEIDGLVVQDPVRMGYLGVKALIAHLHGQDVEKRTDTGVLIATPQNAHEPEIHKLLQPELDKWLK